MTQSDNRNRDDNLLFDPTSNLVTYTSDDCGPRGKDAYFDNLNECPDGYVLIGRGGTIGEDQEIVVDGCRYFSYQVFHCLSPRATPLTGRQPVMVEHPHSRGRRDLMEDDHRGVGSSSVPSRTLSVGVESHIPISYFDPADSLVGYISDNCGPRGAYALADLEQCEPAGHEKVEWVPWQDGKPIVNVDGCLYFSFEVYECLSAPRVDILDDRGDYGDVIALVGPDDVVDEEHIESDMSCAVAVSEGSCDEGGEGIGGVFMGTTSDAIFLAEDSYYDGEQLDGKVMLFHDYDGTVIGCGAIRPAI